MVTGGQHGAPVLGMKYYRQRPGRRSVWGNAGRDPGGRTKNRAGAGPERVAWPPSRCCRADPGTAAHLTPAVALGHHAPVRDGPRAHAQKQLSCVLVVEHGQLVGVLTEREWSKVVATAARCGPRPLREVMQPDPECLHLDDALVYAFHQMHRGAIGMSPWWTRSGGPPRWCRYRRSLTSSSRRSRRAPEPPPSPAHAIAPTPEGA